MNKKIVLFLSVVLLLTNLVGCGYDYDERDNQSQGSYEAEDSEEISEQVDIDEETLDTSIKVENDIAYFDMDVNEFVQNYNATLTNEAEYVAKSLKEPQYLSSGTGLQQTTIYQYDVSNGLGSIHTFVHTNENEKILELSIGIEKVLGQVNVDLVDVLYNDFGGLVTVLTDFTDEEWEVLADGLAYKIANQSPSLHYYYKGIVVDSYSNERAVYFRISCMTEEMYNDIIN